MVMKIAGVVAEFNPFHKGHAALLAAARQNGATHIVAVMSGNFVQRGDFAVTDKRVRAHAALFGGADLVVGLPVAYATSTAQRFAQGAVSLLAACGCVSMLCFGSEAGDASALRELLAALEGEAVRERMRSHLAQGLTFAKARQLAVAALHGTTLATHLASPNNILALEYLHAAQRLGWSPEFFTLRRTGAAHDAPAPGCGYASASYLRARALDFDTLARYIPAPSLAVLRQAAADSLYPADSEKLAYAVLARLRMLEPAQLLHLPDLSEGLENRLYEAIRRAAGLADVYAYLKSKRYTLARIRRLVLHAFLGVTARDCETPPPYLHVLGFNARGKEALAEISRNALLPVGAQLVRLRGQSPACGRTVELECRTTDLYTLALPRPRPCGYELSASGIFL